MTAAPKNLATADDLVAHEKGMEIVGGALEPKAAPTFAHGDAQSAIAAFVKAPFQRGRGGPGGWWIGSAVEIELTAHDVFLPDLAGWRRERLPERPQGTAYHRAGVPHYWVVDPEHETLLVYRATSEGYVVALTAGRQDVVRAEPFGEVEIHVGDLFGGS